MEAMVRQGKIHFARAEQELSMGPLTLAHRRQAAWRVLDHLAAPFRYMLSYFTTTVRINAFLNQSK
jgi:hypothetical protein